MTTSTSDSDLQLLTLNIVSTCSRTPSALRHSKRSNILEKDVNRNIQKLSRKRRRWQETRGKKTASRKFFTRAMVEATATTTSTQIWLFSAALQVNFLLAFALRIRRQQCQSKCPVGWFTGTLAAFSFAWLALQFQIFCHLRQVPKGAKRYSGSGRVQAMSLQLLHYRCVNVVVGVVVVLV